MDTQDNKEEVKQNNETKADYVVENKKHKKDLLFVLITITASIIMALAYIVSDRTDIIPWLPFTILVIGPGIFAVLAIVICIICIKRKQLFAILPLVLTLLFLAYWIFIWTQRK